MNFAAIITGSVMYAYAALVMLAAAKDFTDSFLYAVAQRGCR